MRLTRRYIVPSILVGIVLAVFIAFIGGEVVMRLWNWLVPSIAGWRQITRWEGLGLLVLCRILFGGHHVGRSYCGRRSPEEREQMRQRIRERFGFGSRSTPHDAGQ